MHFYIWFIKYKSTESKKTLLFPFLLVIRSVTDTDMEWSSHDDVIKWKHFPRDWPFVREIHRSPVNFPHKGQWRGALIFTLICARINGWVNNHEAGDLRRNRTHCAVTVMSREYVSNVIYNPGKTEAKFDSDIFRKLLLWPSAAKWTNAELISTHPNFSNFSGIGIKTQQFSVTKMQLKMQIANWRPFCSRASIP